MEGTRTAGRRPLMPRKALATGLPALRSATRRPAQAGWPSGQTTCMCPKPSVVSVGRRSSVHARVNQCALWHGSTWGIGATAALAWMTSPARRARLRTCNPATSTSPAGSRVHRAVAVPRDGRHPPPRISRERSRLVPEDRHLQAASRGLRGSSRFAGAFTAGNPHDGL